MWRTLECIGTHKKSTFLENQISAGHDIFHVSTAFNLHILEVRTAWWHQGQNNLSVQTKKVFCHHHSAKAVKETPAIPHAYCFMSWEALHYSARKWICRKQRKNEHQIKDILIQNQESICLEKSNCQYTLTNKRNVKHISKSNTEFEWWTI